MYYRVTGEELKGKFQGVLDKRAEANAEITKFLEELVKKGHEIETDKWSIPHSCVTGICAVHYNGNEGADSGIGELKKENWCRFDQKYWGIFRPRNTKKNKELVTTFKNLPKVFRGELSGVVGVSTIGGIGFTQKNDTFYFEVPNSLVGKFESPEGAVEIFASEYYAKEGLHEGHEVEKSQDTGVTNG